MTCILRSTCDFQQTMLDTPSPCTCSPVRTMPRVIGFAIVRLSRRTIPRNHERVRKRFMELHRSGTLFRRMNDLRETCRCAASIGSVLCCPPFEPKKNRVRMTSKKKLGKPNPSYDNHVQSPTKKRDVPMFRMQRTTLIKRKGSLKKVYGCKEDVFSCIQIFRERME